MCRMPAVCTLALALTAAGCAASPHGHGGQLVAEYRPGGTPQLATTPYQATYLLYQWAKPPGGPAPHTWVPDRAVTELYARGLAKAEPVGFERGPGGLLAVAGDEKIPLEEGRYCWHISSDTEYHGMGRVLHETGEAALTVIALPFATAAWVCAVPVFGAVCGLMLLTH